MTERPNTPQHDETPLEQEVPREVDGERDVDLDDATELDLPPATIDADERIEADGEPDLAPDAERPAP